VEDLGETVNDKYAWVGATWRLENGDSKVANDQRNTADFEAIPPVSRPLAAVATGKATLNKSLGQALDASLPQMSKHSEPSWRARFDQQLLAPPVLEASRGAARQPQGSAAVAAWLDEQLRWCHAGAYAARRAGAPSVPWAWAQLALPSQPEAAPATRDERALQLQQWANRVGLLLDGSLLHVTLALRLRVKAFDVWPWRARQPSDPWDAGWLRRGPVALHRASVFAPRRPTLILVDASAEIPWMAQLTHELSARSGHFTFAVRLLALSQSESESDRTFRPPPA